MLRSKINLAAELPTGSRLGEATHITVEVQYGPYLALEVMRASRARANVAQYVVFLPKTTELRAVTPHIIYPDIFVLEIFVITRVTCTATSRTCARHTRRATPEYVVFRNFIFRCNSYEG